MAEYLTYNVQKRCAQLPANATLDYNKVDKGGWSAKHYQAITDTKHEWSSCVSEPAQMYNFHESFAYAKDPVIALKFYQELVATEISQKMEKLVQGESVTNSGIVEQLTKQTLEKYQKLGEVAGISTEDQRNNLAKAVAPKICEQFNDKNLTKQGLANSIIDAIKNWWSGKERSHCEIQVHDVVHKLAKTFSAEAVTKPTSQNKGQREHAVVSR